MDEMLDNDIKSGTFVQNLIDTNMSKKVEEIDEKKMGPNPFSQELTVYANKVQDTGIWIIDEDDIKTPAHHLVERDKATRVYHTAGAKERVMALSAGALRMYVYIMHTLDGTKDYVRVTPETYNKKVEKGSLNTYKRAIEELIRYGYITLTIYKGVYWVNPGIMFAGNRINKYPDKVKIKDYTS